MVYRIVRGVTFTLCHVFVLVVHMHYMFITAIMYVVRLESVRLNQESKRAVHLTLGMTKLFESANSTRKKQRRMYCGFPSTKYPQTVFFFKE